MSDDEGLLLFHYKGCVFRLGAGAQPPKAGSLLFCRHLDACPGETVLEIGCGTGLAAVLAARAGAHVVATDIRPEAVACTRDNAADNGVSDRVDVRLGDGFGPVAGLRFDLICTSPPQMPTPPERERDDAEAAADNGGPDGWSLLDRVIREAPGYLEPGGRLLFTLFGFLGIERAQARLRAAGLEPRIVARESHAFPRIGYERLEHIRSLDVERTIPPGAPPRTVDRYVVAGYARR
ncbi:MAG TPA: HemK2/MTQ2 family protein methyltransferase [Candidatus Bathyarchaeia archaeon]|nr:HemK2/MTQ2 family protein methyltransferase [Candidatus Bathyarchaeia archaeon]